MNPADLLLSAEAAVCGRARPRRRLRHVHLEERPLAIALFQMANEAYALWAALVGRDRDDPRLILAPEPRNRDMQFRALAELGSVICELFDEASAEREPVPHKNKPPWQRCTRAPQVLLANDAALDLLSRLGRRMRPAGFGGDFEVPPQVNIGGAHLAFFADAGQRPGSSVALVATRELARHWVTGQSAVEDGHLGAQLAWHDPELLRDIAPEVVGDRDLARMHGAAAARLIEQIPMGVLTNPDCDNEELLPALEEFNARRQGSSDPSVIDPIKGDLEALLTRELTPLWRALWVAYDRLADLNEAESVPKRWEDDRSAFTRHVDYIERGGRIASVDSAKRAVMLLADWEGAQARLERAETLEDPLAMAAAVAAGHAISGEVVSVDRDHRELTPKGSLVSRPLITLVIEGEMPFPVGYELWWTRRLNVKVVVESLEAQGATTQVVLKVVAGMRGELPERGEVATFSQYSNDFYPSPEMPNDVPWTHTRPEGEPEEQAIELEDGPPLDEMLAGEATGA